MMGGVIAFIIFACTPLLICLGVNFLIFKDKEIAIAIFNRSFGAIVMGFFLGFLFSLGLFLVYVALDFVGLHGTWAYQFEAIVFESAWGALMCMILVLTGAVQFILVDVAGLAKREKEQEKADE